MCARVGPGLLAESRSEAVGEGREVRREDQDLPLRGVTEGRDKGAWRRGVAKGCEHGREDQDLLRGTGQTSEIRRGGLPQNVGSALQPLRR